MSFPNPRGYWKFDNSLADASGNGYDMTGSPSYGTGEFGQAINGNTATLGTQPLLTGFIGTGTYSLSFWAETPGKFQSAECRIKDASAQTQVGIVISGGSGNPAISGIVADPGGGTSANVSASPALSAAYHNYILINNAGGVNLYIDGVSVGSNNASGVVNGSFVSNGTVTVTGSTVHVDEVAVWDSVLTAGNIAAIVAATGPISTLVPPVNTVAPVVTGTAQVDQTLTTTDGTYTGTVTSYAYLWKHGDDSAAAATATNSTYICAAGDVGFSMKCLVTPSNNGGPGSAAASSATTAVLPAAPVADFTGTPTSGTASLSVAFTYSGTGGTPDTYLYEKNDGSGWVNFAGTPTVANPTEVFAAGTWSTRCTATNAGGPNTKTRTNYITATQPVPVNSVAPVVTPGSGLIGATFTSTTGTWSNTPTSYAYQWKLDGSNVGTNASTYAPVAAGSLTCTVTASNTGGAGTPAVSNAATVSAPSGGGSLLLLGVG